MVIWFMLPFRVAYVQIDLHIVDIEKESISNGMPGLHLKTNKQEDELSEPEGNNGCSFGDVYQCEGCLLLSLHYLHLGEDLSVFQNCFVLYVKQRVPVVYSCIFVCIEISEITPNPTRF